MGKLEHVRTQHAVGQGGFHSASVTLTRPSGRYRFDYVYDCGALKNWWRSPAVKSVVDGYEPRYEPRTTEDGGTELVGVIDALVLSHYDYDHINGAELLAEKFDVRRIYAPYLSPIELALEISRQADSISEPYLEQLFSVANGGSLWGIPVTRVSGGPQPDNPNLRRNPEPPVKPRFNRDGQSAVDVGTRSPYPAPMQVVKALTGGSPDGQLDHFEDMRLEESGDHIWKLRFWNHQVSDEMLFYTWSFLDAVGFPLDELNKPDGAASVIAWLMVKANRDAAVDAYIEAFRLLGTSATLAIGPEHVPNLISLALYSGPWYWGDPSDQLHYDVLPPVEWRWEYWWRIQHDEEVGWLGTGDALLGEPAVWADFSAHYSAELPHVKTVLLPHHGAAPVRGPAFYNPGLNPREGIHSVISVGAKNRYGHPREEVLTEVRKQFGNIWVVTENWARGFREFMWGDVFIAP